MYGIMIALLVFVLFFGNIVGGASRWINVGSLFSFQPSEVSKFVMILVVSNLLAKRSRYAKGFHLLFLSLSILLCSIIILILLCFNLKVSIEPGFEGVSF